MIHAFILVLVLGGEVQEPEKSMYFYDVNRCNYFASQIVRRYGNYQHYTWVPPKHKATAYCKPVYIDSKTPTLYR